MSLIRNVCIIAHVDHGKTTLVDHLLRQSGAFEQHQQVEERVMDSMDLERERGITILAKNTSVRFEGTKINIVDTPGHADFGGEVERIMGMVNGALLLVDAAEGPLPQTRFVLQRSLAQGHRIILVINKVDRPECVGTGRIEEVVNQTFDLFSELGASDWQLDFPIVYTCAREGWCTLESEKIPDYLSGEAKGTLRPLFDLILKTVHPPQVESNQSFRMLISNLSYSDYVGRLAIGRVLAGKVSKGQKLLRWGVTPDGKERRENFTVTQIYTFEGLKQTEGTEASAGEICVVAGSDFFDIGDTLAFDESVQPLPRIHVQPPTLEMLFSVNTSPLAGQEGIAIQSRKLRERLLREVRHNVALRFEDTQQSDCFRLLGRGELQFAILIEQMRREGSEIMVGKPQVLFQAGPQGEKLEPMEKVTLDLPEEYSGEVTQLFQERKGILLSYMNQSSHGTTHKKRVRLEVEIPTRGLLGMRSKFLTATKGEGLMSSEVTGYGAYKGFMLHRVNGALISDRKGQTVEYGLLGLEDRGVLFVEPGVTVYEGMVIGEHNKGNDLNVNPCREKKLTNIRAAHAELLVTLKGLRKMSLEQYLEWIDEDEWIEVTPATIRVRKKVLASNFRSVKREEQKQD